MNELNEVLQLLRTATPMLQQFIDWKQEQLKKEQEEQEQKSQSEKMFAEWLSERRKKQQQEAKDADELQSHFLGGESWQKERFFPRAF